MKPERPDLLKHVQDMYITLGSQKDLGFLESTRNMSETAYCKKLSHSRQDLAFSFTPEAISKLSQISFCKYNWKDLFAWFSCSLLECSAYLLYSLEYMMLKVLGILFHTTTTDWIICIVQLCKFGWFMFALSWLIIA